MRLCALTHTQALAHMCLCTTHTSAHTHTFTDIQWQLNAIFKLWTPFYCPRKVYNGIRNHFIQYLPAIKYTAILPDRNFHFSVYFSFCSFRNFLFLDVAFHQTKKRFFHAGFFFATFCIVLRNSVVFQVALLAFLCVG